jgi:hypothetical protein
VAATRQNETGLLKACSAEGGPVAGRENSPAGTSWASVIVASECFNDDRLSHDAAAARSGRGISAAIAAAINPPANTVPGVFVIELLTSDRRDGRELFLDRGHPVEHDGERRRPGLLGRCADEESFSILRDSETPLHA